MTLEELIIALGYDYDDKGVKEFKKGLAGAKSAAKNFASAIKTVAVGVSAGMLAIGGASIGVGKAVFETGREFEKMRLSLDALEGSKEGGQKALDWIVDFAKTTPLELDQVTKAYINMKNMGLDPTDGSFQALVDTMAATGRGSEALDGIVLALGQAWTKSKLQGDDARQLLERGVPVYDILAEKMGKTTAQIIEMQSKGKLGREEIKLLIDTLGERYAGAADEFSKSSEGIISNISDLFTIFKKKIADAGFFDAVKEKLAGLLSLFDEMFDSGQVDVFAQKISDTLVGALDAVTDVVSGITMDDIANGIDTVISIAANFWSMMVFIKDAITGIIDAVKWVGDQFGFVLETSDALKVILAGIGLLFAPWITAVVAIVLAIQDFNNYLNGTESVIGSVVAAFDEMWQSLKASAQGFYDEYIAPIVNGLKSVGNFFGIGGGDDAGTKPESASANLSRKEQKKAEWMAKAAQSSGGNASEMVEFIRKMNVSQNVKDAAIEQVQNSNNTTTNTANVTVNQTINEAQAPNAVGQATAKAATDAAFQSHGTTAAEAGT